jgi:dTDP-4-dehydrorhamnose reductase
MSDQYVVVGADSLVGSSLMAELDAAGWPVCGTTRRRQSTGPNRLYLDFEDPDSYRLPFRPSYAYIVAAATNYDRCEKDPQARKINVEMTPRLVESLLAQGWFVTLISTNSVFGGERPWPKEDDPHDARIAYAVQKHEAEQRSFAAAASQHALDRLNIVRLTKILARETSPLPSWFQAWKEGRAIEPFSDLIFAPMSARFVGRALAVVGTKRIAGCLHLSGAANVSYVDLARAFASALGVAVSLISPTSATAKGIHIAYKPTYSGLGMERTTRLTGVHPQPLDQVIADLTRDFTL